MSKPVLLLFVITKKSPEDKFCPVTVIFGIAKNPFVNTTDFVEVPEAISSPVSVLFSNTNLAFNPCTNGLALLLADSNKHLNLKNLPLNVPCCATVENVDILAKLVSSTPICITALLLVGALPSNGARNIIS